MELYKVKSIIEKYNAFPTYQNENELKCQITEGASIVFYWGQNQLINKVIIKGTYDEEVGYTEDVFKNALNILELTSKRNIRAYEQEQIEDLYGDRLGTTEFYAGSELAERAKSSLKKRKNL